LSVGALVSLPLGTTTDTSIITLYHGHGVVVPATPTLKCTISSIANTVGAQAACSDTTDTAAVVAGDVLSLQLHEPNASTAPVIHYAVHLRCQ
jgi:hypothetical protein